MMHPKWFVIINPKAGNSIALKQWPKIERLLKDNDFTFEFAFTDTLINATVLVISAANKGFRNLICVGGDGTLHAVVNGLMLQKAMEPSAICVGLIPIGTGNDWAKTYGISNTINDAFQLIKNNNTKVQDIGKIDFLDSKKPSLYFNNLAGIGFDGLVAKKTEKLKHLGKLSYLIAACQSLFSIKNFEVEIRCNTKKYTTKSLMVLVGLCTYSGGGMRLTDTPNPNDGLFDISNVTNFNIWDFIKNLPKLYNGKVHKAKKVKTFKSESILIVPKQKKDNLYMQADGEVLDAGSIKIAIVKKAFCFYC